MIDAQTWEILAARLDQIRQARQRIADDELADEIHFVYDSHDQASIQPRPASEGHA